VAGAAEAPATRHAVRIATESNSSSNEDGASATTERPAMAETRRSAVAAQRTESRTDVLLRRFAKDGDVRHVRNTACHDTRNAFHCGVDDRVDNSVDCSGEYNGDDSGEARRTRGSLRGGGWRAVERAPAPV
jgi:hypothetical protein